MKVTAFTRAALAERREQRQMVKAGYRMHEADWEILRGFRLRDRIVDVKISFDGKYVWTKLSNESNPCN